MRSKARQSGLTLMEQTMVIAAVVLLIIIAMPAARTLFDQMHTPAGVRATISSALASAKAIAAREQHYAGIRFQHACDIDRRGIARPEKSPQTQQQYIIFIIHDFDKTGLANGFRAVEGLEPIELPRHVGVMDLFVGQNERISNNWLDNDEKLIDATTFSIVFSPAGRLVVHPVRIRNRDGYCKNDPDDSEDDIFNKEVHVGNGIAKFLQDDYPEYDLEQEPSRRSFIIYDRNEFRNINENTRYSDYLEDIEPIYLNPYTGTMIKR